MTAGAEWRYELTDVVLMEQLGSMVCAHGRWDVSFGTSCLGVGGAWIPFAPRWPLVSPDGVPLCLGALEQAAAGKFTWPGVAWLAEEHAGNAVQEARQYVELIPLELRQAVGRLGDDQWAALEMAFAVPRFGELLMGDRDTGSPGYVRACLALARIEEMGREARHQLGEAIATRRRPAMLEALSGVPWPPAAVRALARIEGQWWGDDFAELARAFGDPRRARGLSHRQGIERGHTGVRVLRPGVLDGPEQASAVRSVLSLEGECPVPQELVPRIAASLRSATCNGQFFRLVARWRLRMLRRLPFPPAPFQGDAVLQPLASAASMQAEAVAMHNCLASLIPAVVGGNAYHYRWLGDYRATVELVPGRDGTWRVRKAEGSRSTPAPPDVRRQIELVVARLQTVPPPLPGVG